MLTPTLRTLAADGIVTRRAYAQVPPRVDYQLTPLWQSLLTLVVQLSDWAVQPTPATAQARA